MKTEAKELNLLAAGAVFSAIPAALILLMRFRADLPGSFLYGFMLAAVSLVMYVAYIYASRRFRTRRVGYAKRYQMFIFGLLLCPVLVFITSFTADIFPAYTILSLVASGIFVELTK